MKSLEDLRDEIATHKAAIRRHRSLLGQSKAELVARSLGAAHGIRFIWKGEEVLSHGRDGTHT